MKILVICQYYYPEPFRISDICEALVQKGHEVTVVTGVPNYPEGVVYEGYEKGARREEMIGGVHVFRCRTVPRKTGVIHRVLNYYSYPHSSTRFIQTLPGDYDVVFINQLSPIMMARAGLQYAKRHHKPVLLYCLDLWPVNLVAGGVRRNSKVYRYYHRVARKIYTAADEILVTSRSFSDFFEREFGIDKARIAYLPQYAEELFGDVPSKQPDGVCDLVFAGNIGKAQSVMTIIEAAEILQNDPVRFHIVGGGVELESIKARAETLGLANVTFYGRRPLEEMPGFYAKADAMLLTMEADPVISMTLPGKLQSYMAAGKPVIGAIDGEAGRVIEEARCGFCGKAEDARALADNIRRFIASDEKAALAKNARDYYERHYDKAMFIKTLETEFSRVKERYENRSL